MTTRRRARRVLPAMLAALALTLSMAQGAGAAAHPRVEGKPLKATHKVHLSRPKLVNPTGHAQPKVHKSQGPLPTISRKKLAELKAEAAKHPAKQRPGQTGGNRARKLTAPPSQGSFEGLGLPCCLRPPDTHGAVSRGYFVEVTNGAGVGVYNKSDGSLLKNVSLASFFGYTAQEIFDPRVVYDKKWNRWVISAEAFQEDQDVQKVFYAVSTSSNPLGSWYIYTFDPPEEPGTGDFYDFPQLGYDQDAVIVTANIFRPGELGYDYIGSRAFGMAKADLYNGRFTDFRYFDVGLTGTVAPPIVEDDNSSAFLVAAYPFDTELSLFKATGLGRSDDTIVQQPSVPVPGYTVPPSARQPGTTAELDTMDARFQNNSTQIGNQLLNIHTIAQSGFPTPRWYQINTTDSTVQAGGVVHESADSDDFNPSAAGSAAGGTDENPIGRMFFTWSSTNVMSTPHQARVKSGGRLATDDPNVLGGNTHSTASTFYAPLVGDDPVQRWGDYSSVTINPSATSTCPVGNRAYVVNERQINTTDWGSRIGRLGFCG
ncbi:hypothetical protein ACFWIO_17945 [Streptomyces diastatochromogenes]|uniref:hypothetical protein n=1 Tax=Streptomyces diastatochromogenes TaxID=42236 RepID=UPI003668EFA1